MNQQQYLEKVIKRSKELQKNSNEQLIMYALYRLLSYTLRFQETEVEALKDALLEKIRL